MKTKNVGRTILFMDQDGLACSGSSVVAMRSFRGYLIVSGSNPVRFSDLYPLRTIRFEVSRTTT